MMGIFELNEPVGCSNQDNDQGFLSVKKKEGGLPVGQVSRGKQE